MIFLTHSSSSSPISKGRSNHFTASNSFSFLLLHLTPSSLLKKFSTKVVLMTLIGGTVTQEHDFLVYRHTPSYIKVNRSFLIDFSGNLIWLQYLQTYIH